MCVAPNNILFLQNLIELFLQMLIKYHLSEVSHNGQYVVRK
jgi:hypothetical protein